MNLKEHFTENEAVIIDVALKQAELFLHELGTFYPFGTILTGQGEIKPVSGYMGNDHPDHNELIKFLHNVFENKMNSGNCKFAVLCVDIFVNQTINGESIKKDAIELRVLREHKEWSNYFILYKINEKDVTFYEVSKID